jgi:phage/plasmid primase-like uncharacterized protein
MADFALIKQKYRENPIAVLQQLVGQGKIEGSDYVALNPRRKDSKLGSFRIDINTGRFHDFATGDKGGSIIDLAVFVYNCGIVEAARHLESLFPFLARQPLAVQGTLAKKKEVDIRYIWKKSIISEHEYLKNKKISLGNALVNSYKGQSRLVIPLTDFIQPNQSEFTIKALQFIDEDGNKRFSGSFKGLFHVASDYNASKDVIVIAEGYATARSIVQALDTESKPLDSCTHNTGSKIILAAMSACNLKNVVKKISEQLPDSRIVIAADNDEAGRNAAQGVSDIPNVQIVYPTQGFKDFNDMYQVVGAEGVRNVFCLDGGEK